MNLKVQENVQYFLPFFIFKRLPSHMYLTNKLVRI